MIFIKPALAVCPVCVVAVGSGLLIAEKLGVDDLIASIWIGALMTAIAIATANKFRLVKLPKPAISWPIIFYLLTIIMLEIQGKLSDPYCQIWGISKIWLGITVGTIVFAIGVIIDGRLRGLRDGKALFPFQKVILPLAAILIISLLAYLTVCR